MNQRWATFQEKKKSEYDREDDSGSWENNDDHTINVYERHRTNKQR